MSDPLLSTLCSICHTNPPKYTCPRCRARTCSAACVRTHKTRASCNGVRDPTSYVPRSQLSTAAGVDHDYNFISGIERRVEAQEERARKRDEKRSGKVLQEEKESDARAGVSHTQLLQPPLRNPKFWQRLRETGARIKWAPKGMGRARENRTRWPSKKKTTDKQLLSRIVWTVEWIHADGSRTLDHEVLDTVPMVEAYWTESRRILKDARRKRKQQELNGDTAQGSSGQITDLHSKKVKRAGDVVPKQDSMNVEKDAENSMPEEDPKTRPEGVVDLETDLIAKVDPNTSEHDPTNITQNFATSNSDPPSQVDPIYHFYLHRPYSSSARSVLIPIPRTSTLFAILRNQIILEYPTIYALYEEPDQLPLGYVLEATYLAEQEREQREMEGILDGVKVEKKAAQSKEEAENWDEQKLLESLRKDFTRVK